MNYETTRPRWAVPDDIPVQHRSTWKSWRNMKERCDQPWDRSGHRPGYRVAYCARWKDFDNFLEDLGTRPPGYRLIREDLTLPYEPGNVKWVPEFESVRPRR